MPWGVLQSASATQIVFWVSNAAVWIWVNCVQLSVMVNERMETQWNAIIASFIVIKVVQSKVTYILHKYIVILSFYTSSVGGGICSVLVTACTTVSPVTQLLFSLIHLPNCNIHISLLFLIHSLCPPRTGWTEGYWFETSLTNYINGIKYRVFGCTQTSKWWKE